jgi:dimethylargininase
VQKFPKNKLLTAIAHKPSPYLNKCQLTYLPAAEINLEKANLQHESYCRMLSDLGLRVINLDKNLAMPDCAFVEDTAIVLDEIAIITPMGVSSRQEETKLIEKELAGFRPVKKIYPPAKIEGGDVLRIGKDLCVGLSTRTNKKGIVDLKRIVKSFGYKVYPVKVKNSLHLKTACTALDDKTILLNGDWVDERDLIGFKKIFVPEDEPFAANILKIKDTVCIHSGWTKTIRKINKLSFQTKQIDISEFLKAEAGLTCLSLIFTTNPIKDSQMLPDI